MHDAKCNSKFSPQTHFCANEPRVRARRGSQSPPNRTARKRHEFVAQPKIFSPCVPGAGSDGFFRLSWMLFSPAARFHFDESQHGAIIADQIDFAFVVKDAVIACDENVSMAAQVPIRECFAANAGAPRIFLRRFTGL